MFGVFSSMRPHAAYINNMEVVNCLFNILVIFSLGYFTHNNVICINYIYFIYEVYPSLCISDSVCTNGFLEFCIFIFRFGC